MLSQVKAFNDRKNWEACYTWEYALLSFDYFTSHNCNRSALRYRELTTTQVHGQGNPTRGNAFFYRICTTMYTLPTNRQVINVDDQHGFLLCDQPLLIQSRFLPSLVTTMCTGTHTRPLTGFQNYPRKPAPF